MPAGLLTAPLTPGTTTSQAIANPDPTLNFDAVDDADLGWGRG
ncbi:MAG: hypothetical protein WAO50_08485 [Candidatus Nanopelagicales bacterium]